MLFFNIDLNIAKDCDSTNFPTVFFENILLSGQKCRPFATIIPPIIA